MPHFQNSPIIVVGTFYTGLYSQPKKLAKIISGRRVILKREPHNPYDANAVKVYVFGLEDYIGYIPKEIAGRLAPILDRGSRYESYVLSKRGDIEQPKIIISLTTCPIKTDPPRTQRIQVPNISGRRLLPGIFIKKRSRYRRHGIFSIYLNKYFGILGWLVAVGVFIFFISLRFFLVPADNSDNGYNTRNIRKKPKIRKIIINRNVSYKYYTVKGGDNLINIAQKFNVSVEQIVRENNIQNKDIIHSGTVLKIPQTLYQNIKEPKTHNGVFGNSELRIKK